MASLYYYTARSPTGAFVRGSLESSGATDALASLRRRSLFVTALAPARSSGGALLGCLNVAPVKRAAMVGFTRCIAALLEAGVPLRRSLQLTLERCDDARLSEALRSVLGEIESGAALSAALGKRPREFSALFIAMVAAGEAAGNLDGAFGRMAVMLERDFASRKRLAAALAYPAFLCASAITLVLYLIVSIVPSFSAMYDQMHVPLPRQTAALVALGHAMQQPNVWGLAIAAMACAAAATLNTRARHSVARTVARAWLRLPLIGTIVRKSLVGRVAGTLANLLRSGIDLTTALDVAAKVAANDSYAASLQRVRAQVVGGGTLAGAFRNDALYEPLFSAMVDVGEESGALDALLARIAAYYERDVNAATETLTALAEPAMILILGAIVGCVMGAVVLPLYSLIGSIK
ncbi:MAG: type II secretion system F family protein [Candidatus Eremiobacteraeota bacterium]|nr:type II secretion system F family protein [Candidatus Eremiobacteraeota bacterium]